MISKVEFYDDVCKQIVVVVIGEIFYIVCYVIVFCLLCEMFGDCYFWIGFYVVDLVKKIELVVGFYQGMMGCLWIFFGKGVCGVVAVMGEIQLVEDVYVFFGYIVCDSCFNLEIVVFVFDSKGELVVVFDVDFIEFGVFDIEDQVGLEVICCDLLMV